MARMENAPVHQEGTESEQNIPTLPAARSTARSGGGRSFQHRDAANLKEPRNAAVRCLGVENMHLRVIWPGGRTLSRSHRAILSGTLVHRHSCVRRHDPASSRSTSTGAYGTPPVPGGRAGGSSGSAAPPRRKSPRGLEAQVRARPARSGSSGMHLAAP
ncbi:hypothetical protein ABMA27_005373 [Loxostege sticticalis]|uniref:Uncharacterized protein n=1 Tax=Loxostege sticticalis TaxID=481309 RepID=A0ABR3HIX6_LOXSC